MLGPVEVVAVQPFFPPKVQRLISDSEADLMINGCLRSIGKLSIYRQRIHDAHENRVE